MADGTPLSAPISLLIDRNYTITVGLMVDVEIVDGGEPRGYSLIVRYCTCLPWSVATK